MRPRFVRKAREDEEPARSLEDTEWGRRCVGRPRFADAVRTNARVHALIFEAGAAGAVALANTLRMNATIHTLSLDNNYLGDAVALANALLTNVTLHTHRYATSMLDLEAEWRLRGTLVVPERWP